MYCQYNESVHRKEQFATIINTIQDKMFFTFTFAKRRIRPATAYQKMSNTNHFGTVSDSLGGLAAASECVAINK